MKSREYALVGNWGFTDTKKGLSLFCREEDGGEWEHKETILEDISVGQQYVDEEKGIVYFVDERADHNGRGQGGGLLAARLDAGKHHLEVVSDKKSLGTNPSYLTMDKERKYILVTHHTGYGCGTKVVKRDDGKYDTEICFDDTVISLFPVDRDGKILDACDVLRISVADGDPEYHSRHHFIGSSPSGKLFIAVDKGLDQLQTYRIDYENGRLEYRNRLQLAKGSAPRYGAFHPTLPVFYSNNENIPVLYAHEYDEESGSLKKLEEITLLTKEDHKENGIKPEAADMVMHPNGKYMYVSVRNVNCISVVGIDSQGKMKVKQNIDCGGDDPRGLCLHENNKRLYVANVRSGNVVKFHIEEDGTLGKFEEQMKSSRPGNLKFIRTDES